MITVVEVHQFDKLEHKVPVAPDEREEIVYLGIIDPVKDHHVQFYRSQPGIRRRFYPFEYITEPVTAGDLFVRLVVQAVKAHVHPPETGPLQV